MSSPDPAWVEDVVDMTSSQADKLCTAAAEASWAEENALDLTEEQVDGLLSVSQGISNAGDTSVSTSDPQLDLSTNPGEDSCAPTSDSTKNSIEHTRRQAKIIQEQKITAKIQLHTRLTYRGSQASQRSGPSYPHLPTQPSSQNQPGPVYGGRHSVNTSQGLCMVGGTVVGSLAYQQPDLKMPHPLPKVGY